jgi:hypothetical protein
MLGLRAALAADHGSDRRALSFALAHSDLPPAPAPKVHLASSYWMGAQIGITDSNRVRGLYLFSCTCIYLDEHSWTMPVLVHEMVHYLEHKAEFRQHMRRSRRGAGRSPVTMKPNT